MEPCYGGELQDKALCSIALHSWALPFGCRLRRQLWWVTGCEGRPKWMEGSPLVASLLLVAMPFAPSSVVAYPDEAPVRRLLPQVRTGREVRGSLEGRGVG